MRPIPCLAALVIGTLAASSALAETKVVVGDVHLCCAGCVNGVTDALSGLEGVKAECDRKAKTVTLTAKDDAAAQKAIDALAEAGFCGTLNTKAVAFKAIETPPGKVSRIEFEGVHNCCGACNRAIQAAIKTVDGVQGDTAKADQDSFVVEGNFSAADVAAALRKAGFYVKVKK